LKLSVADFVFKHLMNYGVKHVYLVVGGGAMHLNNALAKSGIKYICNHHEQACSFAAEGESRVTGKLAVVSVTSGPGGLNTLTGVMGQWTDSIPVLYISGQVKYITTIDSVPDSGLRQLGDQEINIIDIVKPITKYATMIKNPYDIKKELEKAIDIATSGRPGPVWIDIPLDIQNMMVNEDNLPFYIKPQEKFTDNHNIISKILNDIQNAKYPLIVAGHGIRISDTIEPFIELIDKLGIPVVTTFNGFDIVPSDSNEYIGRIGTIGTRAGNFALQTSDLVLCLGTRNNIRQVSYNWESFAKNAKKIIVDIDEAELHKKTISGDVLLHLNVKEFIKSALYILTKDDGKIYKHNRWLLWCKDRKDRYPVMLDEYKLQSEGGINPYYFINRLTTQTHEKDIIVAGNGTACVTLFQAGIVKKQQRMFWNSGCASMGYGVPAAIGAAFASGKRVICITGDGSFQMNIQELQTIAYHNLPIKLFILNNQGYHSIVQTQTNFFDSNLIGCNEISGVSFPNYSDVSMVYGFEYFRIDSPVAIARQIRNIISGNKRALCEVVLPTDYIFAPKLSARKQENGDIISPALEDMSPFLDRVEFESNMEIP